MLPRLIISGMSRGSIADELSISEETVKVHVSNIMSKLAVSGNQEVNLNYLNYLASRLAIPPTRRGELDQVA